MSARELHASIDGEVVGTLRESEGLWAFAYADNWLTNTRAFPLSPHLPLSADAVVDGASQRPVQWYFDNLLPEEAQRDLLAHDARLDAADAFALLAWYGAESAGSLTLLAPDADSSAASALRRLPDARLAERIRRLPQEPLSHDAPKRMSLAGAQHKLPIVVEDGELFEPAGARASSHILKPDHPDSDYPHSVANEWFVMRLAKRLGLDVPEVQRRYVPMPVYLVERFDRTRTAGEWRRRHTIDACQLLGIDRRFKYSAGSIEQLARLASACRSPALARTRLFSWLVFNVLVGNSDAHLKNLSFLVSHDGIHLAPFYDLLSTAAYDTPAFDKTAWPSQTTLAWPILATSRFADIDRSCMLKAGHALGLAKATAERLLEHLRSRIFDECSTLQADVEAENQTLGGARHKLTLTLIGEARCLRVIQYVVIREMADRLG